MLNIHPVMPINFGGLTNPPNPFLQNCNDKTFCRPCPWHVNDTMVFQIQIPANWTAVANAVVTPEGGTAGTEAIGPGMKDSTSADGQFDFYNFSIPLGSFLNRGEIQIQLVITPPSGIIVPSTYLSNPLNISSDLDDLCCSYEIEFWGDCQLNDEATVQYANGYRNRLRMCGNLFTSGFADVSRAGFMLPTGPNLCATRTQENWTFEMEVTTDERHYIMGYIWQHPHIRFRKFGQADWFEFSPLNSGWTKGRQLSRSVNAWDGSGELVRTKKSASVLCC